MASVDRNPRYSNTMLGDVNKRGRRQDGECETQSDLGGILIYMYKLQGYEYQVVKLPPDMKMYMC